MKFLFGRFITACLILFLWLQTTAPAGAQIIENLYNEQNYEAIVELADKPGKFTKLEYFMMGYAFFQVGKDIRAIDHYNKAIALGLTDDRIYLYRGLAYRYNNQFSKAIESFKVAVSKNSGSQKNYTELANCYDAATYYDSALSFYYTARMLPFELPDAYLKIPGIFQIKGDYLKALEEYKISGILIDKDAPEYLDILLNIGQLEYTVSKNYRSSIAAYSELLHYLPSHYNLYPKLIKSFYAAGMYANGDTLIAKLQQAYKNKKLPSEFQKYGNVPIDEFEWNNQKVIVYKNFKPATETDDVMYQMYLMLTDGKTVQRNFMTQKTAPKDKTGAIHLLCERTSDTHYTYGWGSSTNYIEYTQLKKAVLSVLNGELKPATMKKYVKTN